MATLQLGKWPSRSVMQWLCRNRRYLGLGFAWSHLVHFIFIILFWRLDTNFFEDRTPGSFVPGTIGYLFIAALAATSFDRSARRIGPKAWKLLHTTGVWYLFVVFAISFGKRLEANPTYIWFLLILGAALLITTGGWLARRREVAAPLL